MANLSKLKREKMLEFINNLREQHKTDDQVLIALGEIENELNSKKYGLVWEEHDENVDNQIKNNIPVFSEILDREIQLVDGQKCNFLLEGDNLHSLYLLKKTHKGKMDIIYIDPPYNTGHEDFIYNDKYIAEEDGYRHSKWLSFMKNRLIIAKDLLSDDGVIFISIDDNEQSNLKILCDSIFGEHNFITQFIWEKTQHFGRQKINYYSNCEYVLCYAKNLYNSTKKKLKELLVERINSDLTDAPLYNASNRLNTLKFTAGTVKFNMKDGEYLSSTNPSYELLSPVVVKNGLNANDFILKFKSRWSQTTIDEEVAKGTTFWVKSEGFAIRAIYHEGKSAKESPKQIIFTNSNNPMCAYTRFNTKVGVNEEGSRELGKLVDQSIFSYPKPVSLIKYLINLYYDYENECHKKDFTVLDFFAGSGTTGQAVMELNNEDNGSRNFILCTNNENEICENVTYQRLKTVITGIKNDGSQYSSGIGENLKYYKTDFISKDEEFLSDELLEHLKEMIQLEQSIKVDGKNYLIILDEDQADEVEKNWLKYSNLKGIYISRNVLLSTSQNEKFSNVEMFVIPDYYFDFELKEVGETW